jgi:hypothetical protein
MAIHSFFPFSILLVYTKIIYQGYYNVTCSLMNILALFQVAWTNALNQIPPPDVELTKA